MNTENKSGQFVGYCLVALTLLQPLQPAMAAVVTAKNNNTKVSNINNTTVINIAKPNNSGISHNQFVDFNVSEKGAVLNNSTSAGKSQLAGQLSGNANLQGKNAKLIINEVVGNGKSELKGKTEVFGKQADILIANPNGITCDGCGFINTKNVTLTTGTPNFDKKGAIDALTTTKGTIVIGSKGMDTSNVDYTDIISRAVVLNGQIKAQNLSLIQGSNKINYSTGQVTAVTGSGNKPTVAIDTKALGGMYANQIHLVSTENGVGVNLNNLVTTKNNIVIAADGKIKLGNITAKNNLDVKGKTLDVNNNKKVTSGNNITLAADKVTNTKSQIVAGKDMRIYANDIENKNATLKANNNLWIQKDVNDTRSNSLKNISGTIETKTGDLVIRADSVENVTPIVFDVINVEPDSSKFDSFLKLDMHCDEESCDNDYYLAKLNNFSQKKWFGDINFKQSDYINSARNIISYVNITEKSQISSGKNLYINSNKINNTYSKLISKNDMYLTGGSLNLKYDLVGEENLYLKYLAVNGRTYYSTENLNFNPHTDSWYKWYNHYDLYHDVFFNKNKDELALDINHELISTVISGGNIIADFQNDILLTNDNYQKYTYLTNTKDRPVSLSAGKNIVLKAKNIEIDTLLDAKGSISLLANHEVKTRNSELNSKKDINIIAVKDINLSQSQLIGDNITLISRLGDVKAITADKNKYLAHNKDQIFGSITSNKDLVVNAGNDILIEDQQIMVTKNLEIDAGNNFLIKNSNTLLEKADYPSIVNPTTRKEYFNKIFEKTNKINILGNAVIKAGSDLEIDGITINTLNDIDFIAANDVILTPRILDAKLRQRYFPAEKEPELSSVINSAGNVFINAGRDIYSKAATIESSKNIDLIAGRDFLLPAVAYTINKPGSVETKHVITVIDADKNLTVAVNGDLIANGAEFEAGGNLRIGSHGKMEFNSVVNSNETQLGKTKSASTVQQNVILSSGGDLSLISDKSILLQATDIDANKSINAAAKGGFLFAEAMQESSFYQTKKSKRKWYGKKTTTVKTSHNVVNKVVDFTANDNINLMSAGDSVYQASQIKAGKNINLTSTNGKVIFEGVKDSEFNQKVTISKGFFIKHSDKGYEKDTWQLPVIQAGGKFTVDATKGISADIKASKIQSLENALTLLGNTEGTQWLKDLNKNNNVEWNKVQDAYSSWNHETQSLNPVVAAVIAIAVAVVTAGAGLAAGEMAAGAVGATGTTGTVITHSVAAGFTALSSKATVSLVENKGNISKTLHDLGQSDTVKSIATSMIVGGAMAGFDEAFNISQNANSATNISAIDSTQKLTLISNGEWDKVAQSVIGHSVIDSGVNTAMYGGSFKDRFSTALLSNVGNQLNAEGAKFIGDKGDVLGIPGKLISHAVTSAVAAEIGGGNAKGAAAGALAAELAGIALEDNYYSKSYSDQEIIQIHKLAGAIAGGIITHSPEGVYSGANSAEIVTVNNYLSHWQDKQYKKDLLACNGGFVCEVQVNLYWQSVSRGQDINFALGMVASVPETLYQGVEGMASMIINHQQTFDAVKHLLQHDNTLNFIGESVKSDFIARIDRYNAYYEKAGDSGAFNAGKEAGALLTDIVSVFAGGYSAAKGFAKFSSSVTSILNQKGIPVITGKKIFGANAISNTEIGIVWGKGIYAQGMPWEDFVGKEFPAGSRLPTNFKTFDYYDINTGKAISVKTLDTLTDAKLANPKQIYSTLKRNIDAAADFEKYTLKDVTISSKDIVSKEIRLAVPSATNQAQWQQIYRAIDYGSTQGVKVIVTEVK